MKIRLTLQAQLALLSISLGFSVALATGLLVYWFDSIYLAVILACMLSVALSVWLMSLYLRPITRILDALNNGFKNFIDNDYSISLAVTRRDQLGELVETYNKISESLRHERVYIYQRELLLDTVIQTTPLALILTDDSKRIIYSNSAARVLFHQGKPINGKHFFELLEQLPAPFKNSVDSELSGMFTTKVDDTSETYHLTQNRFLLNGRAHQLYLFKTLTKEISRQEVNVWKKVIRLISHELNNSLAPISSLANSGQLISEQNSQQKLQSIFSTIEDRAHHLHSFIESYAKFARLPKPQRTEINCQTFFQQLQKLKPFKLKLDEQLTRFSADPSQLQQALINLVKNAYESATESEAIELEVGLKGSTVEIIVKDRGKGMSEKNLSNALLPFYSTKASGTGLGLPLCREIVEAHGGKMMMSNRTEGGLKVTLLLPADRN